MIQKCDLSPDAMEVLPLFPTLVWKFSLPDDAVSRINNAVVTKADEVMGHLVPDSPRQFMQSHQKLHRDPQLAELAGFIQAGAEGVLKFLALGRCPIEITGLWVNIGRPGATHKSHRHPNNFFSGTYYARVPQGAGGIQFLDPRSQSGLLSPQPERLNQHNAGKITLPVAEGDLMFSDFTDQHTSPILQRVVDSL